MKKIFVFSLLLLLGACTHRHPLSHMQFQTMMVPPYVVAGWYKITQIGDPLKIYIEGDGNAFDSNGLPTDNPTPKGNFMRELAGEDPSPNVAYLGRPCQYLQTGACSEKDWTSGRFSEQIVTSMDNAVAQLMKKAKTNQVILIGFSGGAQVAGLVAVRHPERVKKLITIAGVLDHEAWTTYHDDMPLDESLNLSDEKAVFQTLNRVHYAGGKDDVVPESLIQDFDPDFVVVVPKAGHGTGFSDVSNLIYEVQ